MSLSDVLGKSYERYGIPAKTERLKSETPLKHFLRPIMEEAMKRRIREMSQQMSQQIPEMEGQESPMVEHPSIDPLQNALMTMSQKGIGGGMGSPQGGAPNGA